MIPAVVFGIATVAASVFYIITVNLAIIMVILPSIAITGYSFYRFKNFSNIAFSEGISELGPVTAEANAMGIYGKIVNGKCVADRIEFEALEKQQLKGDRWYFEDLGKWLHVVFNDLSDEGKLKAFELPDAEYTDPARLAIQLNMARVNDLFQADPSLFDQLKPWIMIAVITIIGFLIFLSGSG